MKQSAVAGPDRAHTGQSSRAVELFESHRTAMFRQTDRMFLILLLAQWAFALFLALTFSPFGWSGKIRTVSQHVQTAVLVGGAINFLPILLILTRPGWWGTRQVVAVAQMLWSALLIHLTGGRIETHFHVFGSLAFLAFYRDWKLLPTATVVVAGDHLIRGMLWPESVYGIVNPEWWRFLEHAFWVIFEDIVLFFACIRGEKEVRGIAQQQVALEELYMGVEEKIVERTAELEASRGQYRALVETANVVPWELDCESWRVTYVGPQIQRVLGCTPEDFYREGFGADRIDPEDRERVMASYRSLAKAGQNFELEYRMTTSAGAVLFVRDAVTVASGADGRPVLRGLIFDVTERKQLEQDLAQAQKLESVGRLAAGVAHEINTPVQFVNDSVHFVRGAVNDLGPLFESYEKLHQAALEGSLSRELADQVTEAKEDADLEYLLANMPKALDRSLDGLDRVATIVRAMKEFAHPDQREMTNVDLNRAIQSTLIIARNEYKYVAEVETDLGDLPPVICHAGDVNQAVLNIVVNAAHAITDIVKDSGNKGVIRVRTRRDEESVVISISDTGGGIPETIRHRIFDPFFTTKEVGKGTGQGLAIARTTIQDKHAGELSFETESGKGTTFHIRLPFAPAAREAVAQAA